jgi:conjugative relaxase-like TrwC/TraI family protein
MFTCARIADVEYYLAEAEKAAEDGGTQARRDSAAYYLDNGAGEDTGVWWTVAPGGLVAHGQAVDPSVFRRLARGVDPVSGKPLVQTNSTKRLAGYDLQFAAPKSVSVLWATGTSEQRAKVEAIHRRAVHAALSGMREEGLIITRRGKGGAIKEAVANAAVAEFMHTTSRAGDPQLHSHAVLLNTCEREDGTFGTLDNARILQYQGYIGAMYRAELAKGLESELGLSISREGRAFKVDGVPENVADIFSKRREAIENAAREEGYTTASDRERAQYAALDTRDRKSDVPEREELEKRWAREIQIAGWSKEAIWKSAMAHAQRVKEAGIEHGLDLNKVRASMMQRAGMAAIEDLEQNNAVFERRTLLCEIQERMQGLGGIEEAKSILAKMEESGIINRIGTMRDGQPVHLSENDQVNVMDEAVYASPRMVQVERDMLRAAKARVGEREFVSPELVEAAILARPGMSDEQAAAVRHALNHDGVSVIEGSAGTGKSYSLGGVADAARDAGMRVYVIAPSHKAKEVARHDTTTDEDSAKAVAGFIRRLTDEKHREHIVLSPNMAVIVDEAGMVGTRDMAVLLRKAEEAGAKVILAGDTRQLQPVTAGGPMAAIARLCGTQRIETIRRQEKEWQRTASHDFATGNADRALEEYHKRGRMAVVDGYEATIGVLVEDWRRDVDRNPEQGMEKPHEARLVVAGRHKDVKALNAALRASYREAGRLEGPDVMVEAISRGQNGKPEALALAKGDRLIFGEAVTIAGVTVNNSDMGTVEAVQQDERGQVFLRVALDKGGTMEGPWTSFIGWREEGAPDAERHPKMQHAYAITVHAAQGTTVNRCYAFNAHGMGMESAYVAMTRHRQDAKMYVDGSRIIDRMEAQKAKGFRVGRKGADTADAEEVRSRAGQEDELTLASLVCAEVMRSEQKRNVSDFVEDHRAWLNEEEKTEVQEAAEPEPPVIVEEPALTTSSPTPPVPSPAIIARRAEVVALMQERREALVARHEAMEREEKAAAQAEELRRRMEERSKVQQRIAGMRGLSPQAELEAFAREIDLPAFLESRGYRVTKSWNGGRTMENGDSKIQVAHKGGRWVWTTPNGAESGTIVSYMQKVERHGNLGEVRKTLRAWMGESAAREQKEHIAPSVKAPATTTYDLSKVRRWWARLDEQPNVWLQEARGIRKEVLERFRADIRTERQGSQNEGGACFAHRDETGAITGFQRKGPRRGEGEKRSFSFWSTGGQKAITRMGDNENPAVIYVGEGSIDLLSKYQADGMPPRALLCATDGATSTYAMEELAKLAARHPKARIVMAFDNDETKTKVNPHTGEVRVERPAGEVLAEKAEAAIRAKNPEAIIEREFPPPEFKDWNDAIRGIRRDQAPASEQEQEVKKVIRNDEMREEMRRQMEEENKGNPQAHRM